MATHLLTGIVEADEQGFIRGAARLYPAVNFVFRPLTAEERSQVLSDNAKLDGIEKNRNTNKVLASKVRSWDLRDAKGAVIPVTEAAISRLRPALHDRLLGIIMGMEGPDDAPEARSPDATDGPSIPA